MVDTLYHLALLLWVVAGLLLVGVEAGTPHLLTVAIALELLLVAAAVAAVASGTLLDDGQGPLVALLLLPVAGAESAVSLAHLIAFAPVRGTILLR
jgi:NADH:ubiquinone oxidoreductase subunit K